MAWEEATYIVNKIKGTIVPMLNSLQTNVINGVNDTMNNAINNVLVPKLPDNRDPLTFSTVQMRPVRWMFSIPSFENSNASFNRTSGPYNAPVMGYYTYPLYGLSSDPIGNEIINGKGKVLLYETQTEARPDGASAIPCSPISVRYDDRSNNGSLYTHWNPYTNYSPVTVEFTDHITVSQWRYNHGTNNVIRGNSDTFNFETASAETKTHYKLQAYNRFVDRLKSGYTGTELGDPVGTKYYLLYLA